MENYVLSFTSPPRWLLLQLLRFVEITIFPAIEQFFSFSPALQSKCQKDREEMFYLEREQDAHTHETTDDRCNKFEWTCIKLMLLITMTRSSSRSMHSSRMLGWSQTGKTIRQSMIAERATFLSCEHIYGPIYAWAVSFVAENLIFAKTQREREGEIEMHETS